LSVGSDYPGTLIRDDSQAQLKLVVDELGFRYIRFHAIFHDVLGTVRFEDGKTVYNWSKIDQLYDDLLARHIKPFVELGFTPKALATSQNSIFYWKGNTSHPNPEGWRDLVDAFIRHIEERYGRDEVRTWYFEVWNEPNLSGFWEGGDQKAYFELYDLTAKTIKSIDPACGSEALHGWRGLGSRVSGAREAEWRRRRFRDHAHLRRQGGFLDEKGKSDTRLDPHLPTRSSATCAVSANRFRLHRFRGFRCILPSGAPAIRRATPCMIPTSARLHPDQAQGLPGIGARA
jgi:xylan 1,4-beta-xylosidase